MDLLMGRLIKYLLGICVSVAIARPAYAEWTMIYVDDDDHSTYSADISTTKESENTISMRLMLEALNTDETPHVPYALQILTSFKCSSKEMKILHQIAFDRRKGDWNIFEEDKEPLPWEPVTGKMTIFMNFVCAHQRSVTGDWIPVFDSQGKVAWLIGYFGQSRAGDLVHFWTMDNVSDAEAGTTYSVKRRRTLNCSERWLKTTERIEFYEWYGTGKVADQTYGMTKSLAKNHDPKRDLLVGALCSF